MTDPVNYGFLTRDGFVEDKKNSFKRTSFEKRDNADVINEKRIKGPNTLPAEITTSKEPNKTSWWKSLFGKPKNKKERSPKIIKRHGSDINLNDRSRSNSAKFKANRARKCQSVIENRNIEILHDSADTDSSSSYQESKIQEMLKKQSMEQTSTQNLKATKIHHKNRNLHSENFSSPAANLSPINEETVTKNNKYKQDESALNNEISKPSKPPRKHLSLKHPKNSTEALEDPKHKPKIKRSKSLLSLRNIFTRKHKSSKPEETTDRKNPNANEFLNDLNHKLDCMTSEKNSYNIYEKYPRRNSNQQKVLIHIQTREEMAIKDGVPQWDSQSYKYVSQRQRPRSEILGMSYPYNLMTKLLESSFIGQGNGNGDVQEKSSCCERHDIPQEQKDKDKKDQPKHIVEAVIHADSETNLDKEAGANSNANNQIEEESIVTNLDADDKTHLETNPPITHKKMKSNSSENSPTIGELIVDGKVSKGLHLRSSSLDSSLFGCSFVLTGVSSPKAQHQKKTADVILSKHPYLAESTPLRRMANCLRQASESDMPKKLSPIHTPYCDFPPPPASWNDISEIESTFEATAHPSTTNQSATEATNSTTATSESTADALNHRSSTKYDSSVSFNLRQRRCHSESDLSSFYVSPMKLSEKFEDHSFGKNFSRNTRTNTLLNRMRDRMERLEKLSDTSVCLGQKNKIPSQKPDWSLVRQTPNNRVPSVPHNRNRVLHNCGIGTLKRASLIRNEGKPETSFKQFKKLISNQLEKGRIGKIATLHSVPNKFSTKMQHERLTSEPIYDYLWPQNQCESEASSELSLPSIQTAHTQILSNSSKELTKITYSNGNHWPISSINHSLKTKFQTLPDNDGAVSYTNSMTQPRQFLSSTPIKTCGVDTKPNPELNEAVKDPEATTCNKNCSKSSISDVSSSCKTDEENSYGFGTNEKRNSPQSLLPGDEKIKLTMLEEMQRISTKYCADQLVEEINGNTAVPLKFEDWKDKLRFHWKDGFYDEQRPSTDKSETASQSTLKRRNSDDSSSGDTLVNDFGTLERDSSRSSSQKFVVQTKPVVQNSYSYLVNEYVISYDKNDAKDFMYWDCDETDL